MLMHLIAGSTPAVLGWGALTAIVLGAFDYTGGTLTGYKKDPEMDEFERKEYMRKNRRRPIQETIDELGEGRGIVRCRLRRPIANHLQESMARVIRRGARCE